MEKTNFCILLFFVFLTSMCNSNDYTYDSYEYDEYYYHEKYDYNIQNPEDYNDDYGQGLNDYYDQNLLAPTSKSSATSSYTISNHTSTTTSYG